MLPEQLYVLALCGLILVAGISFVVYRRQQKTIRQLVQQKLSVVDKVQRLERLNQTKDMLFMLISHDLRSPVIRLKQQLHALTADREPPESIWEKISQLEEQVNQLATMITNLLDWSVVQQNGLPTTTQAVDLAVIVAEALADVSGQLSHKQIKLIDQVSESTWVVADRYQLVCILRNLIGNAIKFTPSNGYIRLFTKATAEARLALTIKDTGIGMDADQVSRLLSDPVIRPGTAGERGIGLGLQLCREFLGSDPDALQVLSRPGKGTSVIIRLRTSARPLS